jgi:hypothetical protein
MVFAFKIKWMKGSFVFRPVFFGLGAILVYFVWWMDSFGMITVLPQIFLGVLGGRLLISGVYEKNPKKFAKYAQRGW